MPGTRNGVHNPGEFFLLTRAFVILESLVSELAPQHNYMESFHEEISRLTAKHFSLTRIKQKTTKLARDLERLVNDAPGDTRRILRRIAEGNLGRLAGAIAFAALVIGGSMLLMTPVGHWQDTVGKAMLISGIVGMLMTGIGALRRDHSQR
jgi:ubiquinone biosynthesis protein